MFEVPNAKRVRRDELYGSSSEAEEGHSQADAEDDAEVRAKLNERLSRLLGLDLGLSLAAQASEQPAEPPQEAGPDEEGEEKADAEFEFRLFSTTSKAAAPAKVVLDASDDEDADLGEGAFTVPERPSSYYFAGEPTPEQLQMYRQSALAGDDIVLGARKRAWGLERPWRIIRIGGPARSLQTPSVKGLNVKVRTATPIVEEVDQQKRKRPGKKRRIATRIKAKAEKEKREAAERQKMTKEEHLKEKKKRLNREKKLKRRAKEREQKLAGKGHDGSQPTTSNPADSGCDEDSTT
ncbi:hypothetical protein N0V93_006669 [Gnomoniopsis smithogilvyi]|uniref:Uncharacterized protein n=1 Tax=Gnomoniopsis smithogilvyi TaxID=1191159 RepID=A0A9W8YQ45_9PEZI|nr:hypothetical protein N0V93_006669 [Gnomoniopsis smithogilvyi]